jgi:hypothetical protein
MKKLLLSIISLGVLGCANPSMEDGLESLTQSLAELEASMIALDVEGMLADLSEMQGQAEQMALDVESIEQASSNVQDITSRLNVIIEVSEDWATDEQMQSLLADMVTLSEGVDMLVFVSDYDYDGVMNGLDQCPNTPIAEINDVNGVGCGASQIGG